ncbi:hypothetical protein ACJYYY_10970 [Brochothrix campestris]|uniref:hypothetical protein n=1 Tax=Brochothrix campestris TaxID=2757 RepID=UPI0038D0F1EC
MINVFELLATHVSANTYESQVTGTLLAPEKAAVLTAPIKTFPIERLPHLGDTETRIIQLGTFLLLASIICLMCYLHHRQAKKLCMSVIIALVLPLSVIVTAKATTESKVIGEIRPGELTMEKPTDVSFETTLTGKQQQLVLAPIKTVVADYRGDETGWQIVVKTTNEQSYQRHFQLEINRAFITSDNAVVAGHVTPSMTQVIQFDTSVHIMDKAKRGSYQALLDWQIEPQLSQNVRE